MQTRSTGPNGPNPTTPALHPGLFSSLSVGSCDYPLYLQALTHRLLAKYL